MQDIDAVCVFEKDTNGNVLLTWSYPLVDDELEPVLLARSNLMEHVVPLPFSYSKYKNQWIYMHTQELEKDSKPDALRRVSIFSLCIIKSVFNPEKYAALSKLIASIYAISGDPTKILHCYLSVTTRGVFEGGNLGKFVDADHDNRRAFLASSLKQIIRLFGEDIILLWIAMVTKKRVIIYSDSLNVLLGVIRGLPLLVWHRQNWSILRPYVTLQKNEIADLVSYGVFVAGFTDPSIRAQESLYDLYADINARSVYIPNHAKDEFILGTFHQDLRNFLLAAAEDDGTTDQTIIKNLSIKTKDLLGKLETFRVEDPADNKLYITIESIQQHKLPPGMDRFLYMIASAESMTK